jgi:hypothetical protein
MTRQRIENWIPVGGRQLPLLCSLHVLSRIQERYGSVSEFERQLLGVRDTGETGADGGRVYEPAEVSVGAVIFGLVEMVNEGLEFEAQGGREAPERVGERYITLHLETGVFEAKDIVHGEFTRSFDAKKKPPAGKKPRKTLRSILRGSS